MSQRDRDQGTGFVIGCAAATAVSLILWLLFAWFLIRLKRG